MYLFLSTCAIILVGMVKKNIANQDFTFILYTDSYDFLNQIFCDNIYIANSEKSASWHSENDCEVITVISLALF